MYSLVDYRGGSRCSGWWIRGEVAGIQQGGLQGSPSVQHERLEGWSQVFRMVD